MFTRKVYLFLALVAANSVNKWVDAQCDLCLNSTLGEFDGTAPFPDVINFNLTTCQVFSDTINATGLAPDSDECFAGQVLGSICCGENGILGIVPCYSDFVTVYDCMTAQACPEDCLPETIDANNETWCLEPTETWDSAKECCAACATELETFTTCLYSEYECNATAVPGGEATTDGTEAPGGEATTDGTEAPGETDATPTESPPADTPSASPPGDAPTTTASAPTAADPATSTAMTIKVLSALTIAVAGVIIGML